MAHNHCKHKDTEKEIMYVHLVMKHENIHRDDDEDNRQRQKKKEKTE